jgi:hypothetical protein
MYEGSLASLASLEKRLESAAGQVSHSGTTGGARVQLQLVQELEAALTGNGIDGAEIKAASHGIMSSLLRMLENGLPGPVRVSFLRLQRDDLHTVKFSALQHCICADSSLCVEMFTRCILH